ncbi:MAG: S-methyl-5-thioribose kinase [Chloroflexi bacterium]|nr:S-methyl-5-thioribose kinase [Chloroflexota bacterium]
MPDGYRPLTIAEVPDYVRARPHLSFLVPGDPLHVREVGDGNLNLVFIVRSDPDVPGVVLKQSLPWVRVFGEGWPLTIERARHEADAYDVYRAFAGATNPVYHGFDPVRYVIAMEDLAALRIWRTALDDGEVHADAAADLGTFVARVAFHTSDLGMPAQERKRLVARTINPELCQITEDLVFTEPVRIHEHNRYLPALERAVAALRADGAVVDELSRLKHRFMTHTEALIHGDLHSGSVMVGGGRTVAIDPEFACTGPVGFDLGAIWANSILAQARAVQIGRPAEFRAHVAAILPESWLAFRDELWRLWPERVDDSFTDALLGDWERTVWDDALGFAGAEMIRRLVGFAHVSDIDTLDTAARVAATTAGLAVGRRLLLERRTLADPEAVRELVEAGVTGHC